jgi:Lar family restriction alleviation protein
MSELLNCPFCGSDEVTIGRFAASYIDPQHYVKCEQCDGATVSHASEEEAVSSWNRRATEGFHRNAVIEQSAESKRKSVDDATLEAAIEVWGDMENCPLTYPFLRRFAVAILARAASEQPVESKREAVEDQSLWRHKKTGGIYCLIIESQLESDPDESMVTYRSVDKPGLIWTRPALEFYDGRFEQLARAASDSKGESSNA